MVGAWGTRVNHMIVYTWRIQVMLVWLVTQLILGYQVGIVSVFAVNIQDDIQISETVLGKIYNDKVKELYPILKDN